MTEQTKKNTGVSEIKVRFLTKKELLKQGIVHKDLKKIKEPKEVE